jgi:hypothetical protein
MIDPTTVLRGCVSRTQARAYVVFTSRLRTQDTVLDLGYAPRPIVSCSS